MVIEKVRLMLDHFAESSDDAGDTIWIIACVVDGEMRQVI